jgi:hypothetical protein
MQIRGSLVVTKDLTLNNPGGTAPSKGLVALSDADGKVHWGHLVLLPLDQYYTYPDKGTLVTHMGRVYYSLVNRARGGSILNRYIWKEITVEQLSQDQLDAMNQADNPSYQNPIVTLGELQSNLSSLRLIGDVTGYAEYQEGVLVLRTTIPEPSTAGTSFVRDSFDYIGAQSFMLSQDVVNVLMITVNGQLLNEDQYVITGAKQLDILDELEEEDNVIASYNLVAHNPGITVNGVGVSTGNNIELTPSDIGLGNVDNTADIDKPISAAVQQVLDEIIQGANYEHVQQELAYSWLVRHGLGKYPSVTSIGEDGIEYEGEVKHIDKDNTVILFSAPLKGTATFN